MSLLASRTLYPQTNGYGWVLKRVAAWAEKYALYDSRLSHSSYDCWQHPDSTAAAVPPEPGYVLICVQPFGCVSIALSL
jgi:hypothetical protein